MSRVITGRRYQSKGSRAEKREKRTADNITFDSVLEMRHYVDNLKPLSNAGKIHSIQYHPVFRFIFPLKSRLDDPDAFLVGEYEADFSYVESDTRELRVEDVKAWERHPRTGQRRYITGPDFKWQVALMKVCFGIEVHVV